MMNEYFIPHMKAAFGVGANLSREAESILKAFRELAAGQTEPVAESRIAKKGYVRTAAVAAGKRGRPSNRAWELHPELRKGK